MRKQVSYSFSVDEAALAERVVGSFSKRLQRDKQKYPVAALWIQQPTLMADVEKLQQKLSKQATRVTTTASVAEWIMREIRHLIIRCNEKWLKFLFGTTETEMKRLYLKLGNVIK